MLREFELRDLVPTVKPLFAVPGGPLFYLRALNELCPEVSLELRSLLKPKCGANAVVDYLSKEFLEKQPQEPHLTALKMMVVVPIAWSIEPLLQTLRNKLGATSAVGEARVLLDAIGVLAKSETPEPAKETLKWLSRHGVILNLMWRLRIPFDLSANPSQGRGLRRPGYRQGNPPRAGAARLGRRGP